MAKIILLLGSLFSMLAVMIGAFGAHALSEKLKINEKIDIFTKASQYHFYHSLGLLVLGLLAFQLKDSVFVKISAGGFVIGILLFSGSLYAYSLTNVKTFAHITPFGGLAFIAAWVLMAWSIYKGL